MQKPSLRFKEGVKVPRRSPGFPGLARHREAIGNARGMVLVLTLSVMAIITAMVVEFSYGVYISNQALYNFQSAQRLSLMAKSGVRLAARTLSENAQQYPYTYPGAFEVSHQGFFFKDSPGVVTLRIEDENSKFNVNSLLYPNGILNEEAFHQFVGLLGALGLNPSIAGRVVDWIDPDQEPRLPDSEKASKDLSLDSLDEMLLIPGLDRAVYEKLLPYITIYGNGMININGAEVPVLISLSDAINKEMAERILNFRKVAPFEKAEEIVKVAGFEVIGQSLMGRITVKGDAFRVIATAGEDDWKRIIETVLTLSEGQATIRYWKEF